MDSFGRNDGRRGGYWRSGRVSSGRGNRIRGGKLPFSSASNSVRPNEHWRQGVNTSHSGSFPNYRQGKNEDCPSLTSPVKPSLPSPNHPPPLNNSSTTSRTFYNSSSPSPTKPSPPLRSSAPISTSARGFNTVHPQKSIPPLLPTSTDLYVRRPIPPNLMRFPTENKPKFFPTQDPSISFRRNVNNFPRGGGWKRGSNPVGRNNNTASSGSRSPRRGSKRHVSSPTSTTSDAVPAQNVRPKENGPRTKKKKNKRKSDNGQDSKLLVIEELHQLVISENKTFSEQTEELVSQLEQNDVEKRMRLDVVKDVEDIFSPHLPKVQPKIYGSTFTDIAFKSSDLDIFLYCPNGQPEFNFVLEKGRLMYRSPKFRSIVRVARARVPVIKAIHNATNVDVDISTMSGQAVYNSKLIKHLLSTDNRLRPLAMLISLWSKLNTISGHNRFTSYSIVLMLLYYLQKIIPPILPPLKQILYSQSQSEWPHFYKETPLKNENTMDIAQLFKGFFLFYSEFEFEKVVISPYLGETIPVAHFQNIEDLSQDFELYKQKQVERVCDQDLPPTFMITNAIHVQDPMEHHMNTTKNVFARLLTLFRRSSKRLLHTCQDQIPQNYWLQTIIKFEPLKLDEKQCELLLNYPSVEKDWFDVCKVKFKEMLKILLMRASEEYDFECDRGCKNKDSFLAEANYNVFCKKFRSPIKMYMSGTIPLNELQKQFDIIVNRSPCTTVLFKVRFILEGLDNGKVKVLMIDKSGTGLQSFFSVVPEHRRCWEKLLTDIVTNGKTS